MTREEVIDTLQTWIRNADDEYDREEMGRVVGLKEALHEIKKIEPCDDCISRTEALKHSHIEYDDDGEGHRVVYVEDLEELPSVTPQTSEDCISRTALLAKIDEERKHLLDLNMDGAEHIIVHHARRIIEDMPAVTPRAKWIPVSERLPEECEEVLVWYRRYSDYNDWYHTYGIGFWYKDIWSVIDGGIRPIVYAWQPLPQPYTESKDSEEKIIWEN